MYDGELDDYNLHPGVELSEGSIIHRCMILAYPIDFRRR